MGNPDFISDEDMAKMSPEPPAASPAPAATKAAANGPAGFISDDDMTKLESAHAAAAAESEKHGFVPFLKGAWQGLKDQASELATKPLPTIAYDHFVQPAVDEYKRERGQGQGVVNAGLGAAAKATGDVADAGEALATPLVTPVSAYFHSRAAGNTSDDALRDARNVAGLLALGHGVAKGIGAATEGAGKLALKETGITPEDVARYRENPAAVNDAAQYVHDPESLKNLVDDKTAPVRQAVDDATDSVGKAKDDVVDTKATAQQARADANQRAADAWTAKKEELGNVAPPETLAPAIMDHLDGQSEKLGQLSGQAFDILEGEGQRFDAKDLTDAVEKQQKDLTIGGVVPSIGPEAAAYKALDSFKGTIDEIAKKNGTQLPAPIVKQLIQNLDGASKAAYQTNAGELSPEAARSLATVRRSFDTALKDSSPAYKAQMAELAPQVSLTSEMSKVFGNEQAALSSLRAAGDPKSVKGSIVRNKLADYDRANGTNFSSQLADYQNAQATLKSPTSLEQVRQSLPEVKQANSTLPEEAAHQAAMEQRAQAQQQLAQQKAQAQQYAKIGPNSTENVVKSVGAGRNIEARKQLDALDPSLTRTIQDTQIARKFQRGTRNGSARAVIGKAVGGAGGAVLGHAIAGPGGAVVGGYVGAGLGGFAGGLADQYGGAAVKAALDAGIKLEHLGKYTAPIMAAAAKGPQALAVQHYLLSQKDPEYQRLQQGKAGN